jgi:hypothetical protein
MTKPQVELGQVYRDKDKRMEGRHLKIIHVKNGKAVCVPCAVTGMVWSDFSPTTVSIENLQTRFELIQHTKSAEGGNTQQVR